MIQCPSIALCFLASFLHCLFDYDIALKHVLCFFLTSLARLVTMAFQDVAFLPPVVDHTPHFLKIVVDVKAFGRTHVPKLLLAMSKGM